MLLSPFCFLPLLLFHSPSHSCHGFPLCHLHLPGDIPSRNWKDGLEITEPFMTLTTLAEVTTELGRRRLPTRVTQRRTVTDPQTNGHTEDTTVDNYSL